MQTGVSLNRGHYVKGSHPLLKHAFIEIVKTTMVIYLLSQLVSCATRYNGEIKTMRGDGEGA